MDTILRSRYPMPPRLCQIKIVSGFTVHLAYADGVEREIDLEPYLHGPIFEKIRNDPQYFASLHIDEAGDTIFWSNGADIAPETLYYDGEPPWAKKPKSKQTSRKSLARKPIKRRTAQRKTKTPA